MKTMKTRFVKFFQTIGVALITVVMSVWSMQNVFGQDNWNGYLVYDDFENDNVGQYLSYCAVPIAPPGDTAIWRTWNGLHNIDEDGMVASLNGNKCAHFIYGNDEMIAYENRFNTGVYDVEMDVYVPEGKNGYFNVMHDLFDNSYALEVYLHATTDMTNTVHSPGHGTVNAGSLGTADLPCVYDEWMHFRIHVDIDHELAALFYSSETTYQTELKICQWCWPLNAIGEKSKIDQYGTGVAYWYKQMDLHIIDYYPPVDEATSEFYVDNVTIRLGSPDLYTVSAKIKPESLIINSVPGGTVDGQGIYHYGETCTLAATPNENYEFLHWRKDGMVVSTSPILSFEVTDNIGFDAYFKYTGEITGCPVQDDFESYNVGDKIAAGAQAAGNEWWNTMEDDPGGVTDGEVVYFDGSKCGHLTYDNYQALMLGGNEDGIYSLEFDIYVPEGKAGYFDVQHSFQSLAAMQVFLHAFNDYNTGFTHTPGQAYLFASGSLYEFPCVYDEWMHFRVYVNDYEDVVALYYSTTTTYTNEIEIYEWQWSLAHFWLSPELCGTRLDALSFTPIIEELNSEMYIDNIDYHAVGDVVYTVDAGISPSNGHVAGVGSYYGGSKCTLKAYPDEDYLFLNWTKNGEILSEEQYYTFLVTEDVNIVANFILYEGVTIGQGSTLTNNALPSNTDFKHTVSQQLYTKEEIGDFGKITGISIYNEGAEKTRFIEIILTRTDKSYYENGKDWAYYSSVNGNWVGKDVFFGEVTFLSNTWTTIHFDEPYAYDGNTNIAIQFDDKTGTWPSPPHMSCRTFETDVPQTIVLYGNDPDHSYLILKDSSKYNGGVNWTLTGDLCMEKNQIRFSMEYSTMELIPDYSHADLGSRPSGCWTKPYTINLYNPDVINNINSITSDNPYFDIDLYGAELPILMHGGDTVSFGITAGTGVGAYNGNIIINYGDNQEMVITASAMGYTPGLGDVCETAIEVPSLPYTTSVNASALSLIDNYNIPPTDIADRWDAVHKLTLTKDQLLNASLADAVNGKVALYKEGFDEMGGPDIYNNYNIKTEIEQWMQIYNGSIWFDSYEVVDWGVMFTPSELAVYDGCWFDKVYLHIWDYYNMTVKFYVGGNTPDEGVLVYSQDFIPDNGDYEVVLDERVYINPNENMWVVFHANTENGMFLPARAMGAAKPNAEWYYDGTEWHLTNTGMSWMMNCHITNYDETKVGEVYNVIATPGTYYFVSSSESTGWNLEITTGTLACPTPPCNPSPSDCGTVNVALPVTLHWDFGYRTTQFKLMFGTTPDCEETLVDWTWDLSEEYTFEALDVDVTYYWKVLVRNDGCGHEVESPVWSFTTAYGAPVLNVFHYNDSYEDEPAYLHWTIDTPGSFLFTIYQDGVPIATTTECHYEVEGLTHNLVGYQFYVTAMYGTTEVQSNIVVYIVIGKGTVEGHVYESDGVTPVVNALVQIQGWDVRYDKYNSFEAYSDSEGFYSVRPVVGSYCGRASLEGYQLSSYNGNGYLMVENNMFYPNVDFIMVPDNDIDDVYAEEDGSAMNLYWGNNNVLYECDDWLELWGTMLNGWTKIDADGDGNVWAGLYDGPDAVSIAGYIWEYDTVYYIPDNYLVSPELELGGFFSFMVHTNAQQGANNHLSVLVSTTCKDDPSCFTPIKEWSIPYGGDGYFMGNYWNRFVVDLRAFGGQTGYVAFRHTASNNCIGDVTIDDVVLYDLDYDDRTTDAYRIYRTDAGNNGILTEDNTVLVADNVIGNTFKDFSWDNVNLGCYKYGVSRIHINDRLGQDRDSGQAVIVRNNGFTNDFCHFTIDNPTDLISYGYSNYTTIKGACNKNGTLYFIDSDGNFGTFAPDKGITYIGTSYRFDHIEYNPINGKMYGSWTRGLHIVNPDGTDTFTDIFYNDGMDIVTFTITNEGVFVICDARNDCLWKIDPNTGEMAQIITVDWDIANEQDMAIDRATNTVYWAANNATNNTYPLFKVNLSNNTLETLCYYPTPMAAFAFCDFSSVQGNGESEIVWSNIVEKSIHIFASANPMEGGTVDGAGAYDYGATATLTATANIGYTFVNWTCSGMEVSTEPTYTFTVTESASYVANFSLNSYQITASANPAAGGTVTGADTYNYGTSATLTATENTGYTFVNWTCNEVEVSTEPTYTFTVTESASYVANFSLNSYQVTVSANPAAGGTVDGEGTYDYGATATLTATANTGYTFVNWSENGNVVSTAPVYTFVVDEDASYVANFEINSYQITATANPMEGGIVTGSGTFLAGETCTLTAAANTGYTFVNWTKNGAVVSTNTTYSFVVNETAEYIANFNMVSYTIAASADPTAGGSITGEGTYNHGATCTLTATPNVNYTFVNWTMNGNVVSTNASYSFTVTEDVSYVAHFELITGVDENTNNDFVIYPNPVKDKLMVVSQETVDRCCIYTVSGSLVISQDANSDTFEVEVGALRSGTYIIRLTISDKVQTMIFIKD